MEILSNDSVSVLELDDVQRRAIALVAHEVSFSMPELPDDLSSSLAQTHDRMWAISGIEAKQLAFSQTDIKALGKAFDWFINNQPDDWPHHGLYEGTLEAARQLAGELTVKQEIQLDHASQTLESSLLITI